jgi:hypothetical protein
MSNKTDYNGWENKATWNVALWAGNDEGCYRYVESNKPYTIGKAKRIATEMFGDKTPDGCKLSAVNWRQIAEAWNDD